MGRQPPSRKQVSALRVTKTDKEADATLPDRIASNPVIRTTPVVITQGGTADNPAIFDGQGSRKNAARSQVSLLLSAGKMASRANGFYREWSCLFSLARERSTR